MYVSLGPSPGMQVASTVSHPLPLISPHTHLPTHAPLAWRAAMVGDELPGGAGDCSWLHTCVPTIHIYGASKHNDRRSGLSLHRCGLSLQPDALCMTPLDQRTAGTSMLCGAHRCKPQHTLSAQPHAAVAAEPEPASTATAVSA